MKRILLTVCFLSAVMLAYGQHADSKKLENTIGIAIKKASSASVRICGFDTVSNQQMSAQFSGVVVSKDGDILTAAHVEIPGKTYKVRFPDGREAIAMGLGKIEFAADKTMPDVAMMKIITAGIWPYAAMGSSANLKQHEPSISIAYPESLNQLIPTIRFGRIENIKNSRGFIQSTCKMEPGDSGGPLFDYAGRVIGMHSAIEVAENSNYEIPVDLYRKYWTALHRPEIYTALPQQVDVFKDEKDSNAGSKLEIDDLSKSLQTGSRFKNTCLTVNSIVDGKSLAIMCTLFSLKGMALKSAGYQSLLVSKSSMTGAEPMIQLGNGKVVAATVLARDKENDLVLLQPAVNIKGGIPVKELAADTLLSLIPGKFLLSPQPDSPAVESALGMGSIALPKNANMAFLGAAIAYGDGPLKITRVMDASPASKCDLQVGDEVLCINQAPMTKAEDYGNQLIKYWPGDTITIRVNHQGNQLDKTVILGDRPKQIANHPVEFFAGGKSSRRDGFKSVFTHDGKLIPAMCGGPVFDIDGHFLGINVARFSRATVLVLPVSVVFEFIKKNLKRPVVM
jgi:serine protease Do